jgi:hypothetical protein
MATRLKLTRTELLLSPSVPPNKRLELAGAIK